MQALITRKVGMTSIVAENGDVTAVTLLKASPNVITQIKSMETDGYSALQLGFETTKQLSKAQKGHFKLSKATPKVIREVRAAELDPETKIGDHLGADLFSVGDEVMVSGITKGKGFAGTIKRHNFHRGRKTHGGGSYRRPGSIGSMYPQKILKGKKMAGQMGHVQATVSNLKVALVDTELDVIGVTGAVPGPKAGIILVRGAK